MPGSLIMQSRKAGEKVDKTELLTNLGVVIAGIIGIWAAYFKKGVAVEGRQSALVASVGLDIGNRQQLDEQIHQLKRIADSLEVLADRRQATFEDKIDEVLERLERTEKHNRAGR